MYSQITSQGVKGLSMSDHLMLPKDHLFLSSSVDMDELLTPIKRMGVNYFTFMRNFKNGDQIYLSNINGWVEDYYQQGLYRQFISKSPDDYSTSRVIWPKEKPLAVFDLARERYNSDHGVTYIKTRKGYSDYYFFSTTKENSTIINFYLNHGDILERFIAYFEDRAESLIRKAENHKVRLPIRKIVQSTELGILPQFDPNEIVKTVREMQLRKYRLKGDVYQGAKLSRQELGCIMNYIERRSAEDTGKKMNIKRRTVEAYFENIKAKLHCDSKDEIVRLLIDDGFDLVKALYTSD